MNTTTAEYSAFDEAYDYFNSELFDGALPMCLITLQRKNRTKGYFSSGRFTSRIVDGERIDELAMNPDHFGRTDREILSTLVHEMAHVWQAAEGKPSRSGYHNKEWADKMVEIGLMPSHTGEPGGKRTGQQMTHYIVEDGPFDRLCADLLADGFKLNWQSFNGTSSEAKKKREAKQKSKTKYTCPTCNSNAWAKPETSLLCGDCLARMVEQ